MFSRTHFSTLKPQVAGIALAITIGLSGTVAAAQTDATPSPVADISCAVIDVSATPESEASPVSEEMSGEAVTDEATIALLTDVATTCNPDAGADITDVAVTQYGDDLYGIEYQYMHGHQVLRVLEMYSVEHDTWTLRQQKSLSPQSDEDTITLSAKIGGDTGIEVTPGSFNIVGAMRVNILNRDASDLSLAVFSATDDVDVASLAGQNVADLPDTLELQGEMLVPAGTSGDMLFEGLAEGSYVFVALDAGDSVINAAPVTIEPPLDLGL
ncbi:MAG TPA: hypothetical protein VNZ58_04795 [Thermomicrobiales bacterium]|nr:hypothetical protein [Thermomicrobiales bacterium]